MGGVTVQPRARVTSEVQMRATDEQLADVQRQVSRGTYEVNSQRVAVAILERIGVIQSRSPVMGRGGGHALLQELSVPRGA
jgi:hypothetical protein